MIVDGSLPFANRNCVRTVLELGTPTGARWRILRIYRTTGRGGLMKIDLAGKIKNTQLPRSKALLPMFEAVVNSFQAIEDAGATVPSPRIEVTVKRDVVLPHLEVKGQVDGF